MSLEVQVWAEVTLDPAWRPGAGPAGGDLEAALYVLERQDTLSEERPAVYTSPPCPWKSPLEAKSHADMELPEHAECLKGRRAGPGRQPRRCGLGQRACGLALKVPLAAGARPAGHGGGLQAEAGGSCRGRIALGSSPAERTGRGQACELPRDQKAGHLDASLLRHGRAVRAAGHVPTQGGSAKKLLSAAPSVPGCRLPRRLPHPEENLSPW